MELSGGRRRRVCLSGVSVEWGGGRMKVKGLSVYVMRVNVLAVMRHSTLMFGTHGNADLHGTLALNYLRESSSVGGELEGCC